MAGSAVHADVPPSPIASAFLAGACPGTTTYDPTVNTGGAIENTLEVFGARLTSYNAGNVVPLYDAFGGSALLDAAGNVHPNSVAYPPLCGTRYVAAAGGPVSEWMFCTDIASQSCGDVDSSGNIVDHDGQPVNPMTSLTGNSRLSSQQEKIISYLIRHGHSYAGVGSQSWGGVTTARSDEGTSERAALQTLVWCISDGGDGSADFDATCNANMDTAEQSRILALIPDNPELSLQGMTGGSALKVGDTARMSLTTNIYNQPIALAVTGSADSALSACAGNATINGAAITVVGTNPVVASTVTLCATATTAGTVRVDVSASPASVQQIGWSQSVNPALVPPCQVYATFHAARLGTVSGTASALFAAAPTSTTPAVPSTTRRSSTLADSGSMTGIWLLPPLLAIAAGAGAIAVARHNRKARPGNENRSHG
ncbi:MAG: hypothetical protein EPN48_17880 [Microbacteriaceae bacterium]|nr:MAG: hypothetical protein EPN48_17880 [Microbacteriaceae bacterium]